jgi:hypothetical protein
MHAEYVAGILSSQRMLDPDEITRLRFVTNDA